ncbi:head-tail adaptor [Sphingomonas sp. BE123]|uniref:head-tail adaptor protein n=1 Tax=Sphingomonas sp. BE123 TaxID=2817842 RepID=UPI00286701D8|nr:head-tail adaptor protein [Sphingomonas sp. BE123]MDR6851092.1 head-tail adaptor [Sphingomonas sp. BE123]
MKPQLTFASRLRDLLRIERPVPDSGFAGAGSGTWILVEEVRAEVKDVLPSRGERLSGGINVATRPARIRMRYRSDVTPDMRLVLGARVVDGTVDYSNARIMQITAGPAELGNRDGVEFMAEDYSTAGNAA